MPTSISFAKHARASRGLLLALAVSLAVASTGHAGTVSTPNTFTNGTTAQASEVNGNFSAHETEINDNATRIATLEATILSLTSRVSAIESNGSTVVFGAVNADGTIQFSSDPALTVVRNSVGDYTITIPAGNFGVSNGFANVALPVFMPVNNTVGIQASTTSIASSGVITQQLALRTAAGTPVDAIFNFAFVGALP